MTPENSAILSEMDQEFEEKVEELVQANYAIGLAKAVFLVNHARTFLTNSLSELDGDEKIGLTLLLLYSAVGLMAVSRRGFDIEANREETSEGGK